MSSPVDALRRDAKIIDALHRARYALVIHDTLEFRCEGKFLRADFSGEMAAIDEVMTMLGVDLTEPLPAPVDFPKENDDDR